MRDIKSYIDNILKEKQISKHTMIPLRFIGVMLGFLL